MEYVNSYVYLGLGTNREMGKENQAAEIYRRKRLGWLAFGKFTHVLKTRNSPLEYLTISKTMSAMERQMIKDLLKDKKRNTWI